MFVDPSQFQPYCNYLIIPNLVSLTRVVMIGFSQTSVDLFYGLSFAEEDVVSFSFLVAVLKVEMKIYFWHNQ